MYLQVERKIMNNYIEVSRRWGKTPIDIRIFANKEDCENRIMSIGMDLSDFKEALKKEISSVRWTFTEKGVSELLDKAIDSIIDEMKKSTIQYASKIPVDIGDRP